MTREIKFRGKYSRPFHEVGKPIVFFWVYGSLITCCGKHDIVEVNGNIRQDVVVETIGQFTGLRDKNGTEIYEGDIVKTLVSPLNATKNKRYRNFAIRYNAPQFWNGYDTILMRPQYMEVIGNIYDNPELLKEKDDDEEDIDDPRLTEKQKKELGYK